MSKAPAFSAHRWALWCPTQHMVCAMSPQGAGHVLALCTSFPVQLQHCPTQPGQEEVAGLQWDMA